ncbi:MAG TPA: hypothetical protein P5270_06095 [Victivallales bacterium]|nr:hypothetical protein [Victivallales bacterium]HPO89631.1 hypothetical protein [Victivallales bacterium]HRR28916.1 hypothetical protein [Victivallales bacterium]HRU00217.1 hypothetical protein [Victivallales bacterium]
MIILYFVMILIFRFVLLKSGYPYQGRYLHQLTILSVFPAAFGFCKSLDLIKKYIKRELTICFLLIVVIICAVKILIPPDNKEWLKLIPETIIAHSPSNEGKIFLISSIRDSRLSYYSNAEYHPFIKHNDSVGKITERAIYTKKIIDGKEKLVRENFGKGYNALCNAVKNWGGDNVFILLDSDKETIENQLKELGIKINFIHISDFKTHKGQKISLYQGEKDK